MGDLALTLACGRYDINEALIRGEVTPQGVDLTVLVHPSPQRHWRMGRHRDFDVCEFSLSSLLVMHDRGDRDVVAIPAFPHRRFRHGFIFVNSAAGIAEPGQLKGRRVGVRTWQTTAGLWARGILQDEHDVDLRSIDWFAQDDEDVAFDPPPGLSFHRVPEGRTVTTMLLEGELDALIYPELPEAVARGDARIRRLFPDPKAAEQAYFQRTGIFPTMHTVIVRRDIVDAHPWVALELLLAFRRSKDLAFERMRDPRSISLAWVSELIAEQRALLGPDPWCYEFEPNRRALETMIRYSHEQGLIGATFDPADLFAPSTLEDPPRYV